MRQPAKVPEDEKRRIYRRGYPLIVVTPNTRRSARTDLIAYGRTLTTQFEFITRAWTSNPNFPNPGRGSIR